MGDWLVAPIAEQEVDVYVIGFEEVCCGRRVGRDGIPGQC